MKDWWDGVGGIVGLDGADGAGDAGNADDASGGSLDPSSDFGVLFLLFDFRCGRQNSKVLLWNVFWAEKTVL